jgi:hypothetical protein
MLIYLNALYALYKYHEYRSVVFLFKISNKGVVTMKQKIFITAMVIAALLLPLEINAKGKPDSVVLLKDAVQ